MAASYVLQNLQYNFKSKKDLIRRLKTFTEDSGLPLTLENFLSFHDLTLQQVYRQGSFYGLQVQAGLRDSIREPLRPAFDAAAFKLASIDSPVWIAFLKTLPDPDIQTETEKRMMNMFWKTLFPEGIREDQKRWLKQSPSVIEELNELLDVALARIQLVPVPDPHSVLEIGCTYNREQLFTALGVAKPQNIREGVKWIPEENCDVLLVTLNKTEKEYSPTTLYQDYSISEMLFHWQSQSGTSEDSPTGQRYIHHEKRGSRVLLFVRHQKNENSKTVPYAYLGPVTYVSHTGSKPMSIIWKMQHPIPARYLEKTDKLN